jgi:hypothetical protein
VAAIIRPGTDKEANMKILLRALNYTAKHGGAKTEEVAKHLRVSAFLAAPTNT